MTDPAFFGYDKTRLEIRVLDAAMAWYRTNRHNSEIWQTPMIAYYAQPEVRALVEACADLNQLATRRQPCPTCEFDPCGCQ